MLSQPLDECRCMSEIWNGKVFLVTCHCKGLFNFDKSSLVVQWLLKELQGAPEGIFCHLYLRNAYEFWKVVLIARDSTKYNLRFHQKLNLLKLCISIRYEIKYFFWPFKDVLFIITNCDRGEIFLNFSHSRRFSLRNPKTEI